MDKLQLLEIVKIRIAEKIQSLENLIDETRTSNNDTKSSMGDKYETGREMLQQQINNLQVQLNEALNKKTNIQKISTESSPKVQKGALVKTNKGLFYISESIGEIILENHKIMTISEEAPLAKVMMGMKSGQTFSINNINQTIEKVW